MKNFDKEMAQAGKLVGKHIGNLYFLSALSLVGIGLIGYHLYQKNKTEKQ